MNRQVTLATCIAKMYEGGKLDSSGAVAGKPKKASPSLLGTLGDVEDKLNLLEVKVEQIACTQTMVIQKLDLVSQGMDALEKTLVQFKQDTLGRSVIKPTQKDARQAGGEVAEVRSLCEETVALLKSLKQEGQVQRKKIEGIESSVSTLDKVLGYVGEAFRSSKIVEFILNGVVPWRKQGLLDTAEEEKTISDDSTAKAKAPLSHLGTPEEINEEAAVLYGCEGQEVTSSTSAGLFPAGPKEAPRCPDGAEMCAGKAQRRMKEVTVKSREPSRVQAFAPLRQPQPQTAPETQPSETRSVPTAEQDASVSQPERPSLHCSAQEELEAERRQGDVPGEPWLLTEQHMPVKENLEAGLQQKETVALATPRPKGAEREPESEPVTQETSTEEAGMILEKPGTYQNKSDPAKESSVPQSRTGPAAQSGTSPAAPSGTSPAAQSGTSPAAPSGTSPAAPSGTSPAAPSGTSPAAPSGTSSAAPSGTSPAAQSGTSPAAQSGTSSVAPSGTSPAPQSGTSPAQQTGTKLQSGILSKGPEPQLLIIDDCPPRPAPFEHRIVSAKQVPMGSYYAVKPNELLGGGRFGQVHKCAELSSGLTLAAKIIKVRGMKEKDEVKNEIGVMNQLNHVNLIQLYDAFESRTNLTLIMEYVEGGELFDRIVDEHYQLTELDAIVFSRQICEGVQYLHQQYILHLDLKPENILCVSNTGNQIKIIDFGLARKYRPREKLKVNFGTPEFLAPEVVNYDFVSFPTDMWSVGVITYMLLSGLSPFLGESDAETMNNILHGNWDFDAEAFENVSEEAKDFISRLLVPAKCRLSASGCMKHSWLNNLEEKAKRHRVRLKSQLRLQSYLAAHRQWKKHFYAVAAANRLKRFQQNRSVSTP
ncbi:myosin light chain kinase 3 isoform X2 [Pygocentrus nattereri]|uniref:myosin light chain kinase 3 isoform X2 n=1 Tax=Pygocentrus nattereri TaxID=42514 RepID=UPI00081431F1|nr:myosin light chain kinase 3 isoform X2 [Pygocentrus nattereri]